jgi:hypothetical protein
MTQPKFAPINAEDEVRGTYHLDPPRPWQAHRPGELAMAPSAGGNGRGAPGPDQGYALALAQQLALAPGEHAEDALAGAVVIALRRAASYGRAPVRRDIEVALELFGFLGAAPPELIELRRSLFAGVDHDYRRQRALAESIPEQSLRLVGAPGSDWRALLGLAGEPS